MSGWIKLHRKMTEWEWFDDHNTFRLFMTLLMMANHADKKWRGTTVSSGSMVTGRIALSKKTGLSEQQVRTSLSKLKSTGEIAIKTSNKFSIISISNWDIYQDTNQQDNQQSTNNQPTSNQQVTTNKNVKNVKNKDITPLAMLADMGVDKKLASEWLAVRNKKRLASTQTAFEGIMKEAGKAGLTMNQAIKKAVEESWGGFKASWLESKPKNPHREIL